MNRTAPSINEALPAAFSSLSGLGTPVAFFPPGQRVRVVPLACAALCALAAAVTLAYGLAASATAYNHYGWAVVQELGRAPVLVFWLFVISGFLFGIYALITWSRAAAVYQGGIAFRTLSGLHSWPWPDISALYISITRETGLFPRVRHQYILEHTSGEKATFDDRLDSVTQMGALLGRKIVDQHYPPVAAQFNAGELADFGQVSVDQNRIQIKGHSTIWDEVDFISVRRGYFQLHPKSSSAVGIPVAGIPNLDILLLLLDHIADVRLEE